MIRAPAAAAAAALDHVGTDPHQALSMADEALALARRRRDTAAQSTAHRAAGLALRAVGDLTQASARARLAVRAGHRSGVPQVEAEARMSLAFVLLVQGRVKSALAEADAAAGALQGVPAARLACQRALILQRAGRMDEAMAEYARALPVLRRAGDHVWESRLLCNRGIARAYRGELAAAEADLTRSLELDRRLGHHADVAAMLANLGFVSARRGDAPEALARYDAAEAAFTKQSMPVPHLLLDRCEVLLGVGLTAEARRTAARAVDALRAGGQGADLAEGLLTFAQAALADGDPAAALDAAREAHREFTAQQREGWALLASHVAVRADERAGVRTERALSRALTAAGALAKAGWRVQELDARLAAARIALDLGELTVGTEQLALASAARGSALPELKARAWYAHALLRQARGDPRGAESALRAGLAAIASHQAALGATELRVHAAAHGEDLARLGLAMALTRRDPTRVLAWVERWRAGTLQLRRARPPDDPTLAGDLAELRRLTAEIEQARLAGAIPRGLEADRRDVEARVVRTSRQAAGSLNGPLPRPPRPGELAVHLAGGTLVEYVECDGRLLAVTVSGRGIARLHELGPLAPVTVELESLHFGLRRLATGFGTPAGLVRARDTAAQAARRLAVRLLDPLARELGAGPLVVVPSAGLHPVPWGLLPGSADRPVTVAPSAATWVRALSRPGPEAGGRTVLVAGPRLDAAQDEIRAIARSYPGAAVLVDSAATVEGVLAAMADAQRAHLATHGRLRTDNPLFSALELADGPLTVYDLERLPVVPRLVVLPACQSAVTAVRAGDELMGLATALLGLGTRTVVAATIPVPDLASKDLMVALHTHLSAGQPPAQALALARQSLDTRDPTSLAAAAGFVVLGA